MNELLQKRILNRIKDLLNELEKGEEAPRPSSLMAFFKFMKENDIKTYPLISLSHDGEIAVSFRENNQNKVILTFKKEHVVYVRFIPDGETRTNQRGLVKYEDLPIEVVEQIKNLCCGSSVGRAED